MIEVSEKLGLVYFPAALALGALHALEPGHAKALTAAYLIGIKGTKIDALILGVSVALTHSLIVLAISATALAIGNEAFAGSATTWLERASGLIAILIGSWMLWRRLALRPLRHHHGAHHHDHHHDHDHDDSDHHHHRHDHQSHMHLDDIAHARAHAESLPKYVHAGERPSYLQLIGFGAAGGMIPCPASVTVMLLALSTGKNALGLLSVAGFSLGLAITLVGVGMAVVTGLSRLSENGRFSWVSVRAPVISAVLVIVSGLFALVIS